MSARRMSPEHAGAVRVQLDALLASLEQYDEISGITGDIPVMQLLARLHEARGAALQVEQRPLLPQRTGVRLGKS